MNWQQELLTSLLWLLKTFALASVLFAFLIYIVAKWTKWGQQFWLLAKNYFNPKQHLYPLIGFHLVVFLNLLSVRVDILVSNWYNAMYKALQEMNASAFWLQMWVFGAIATVSILNALLTYYLSQKLLVHWRTWLNEDMLSKWTQNQAYYKTQFLTAQLDNPDQRIQQDIQSYASSSLDFATGLISSVVSIFAFTLILWDLSGPMQIGNITIPHAMVFLVFIYVLISSIFAFKIGRPLIKLNFDNERLNANYRYSLIRLKEYAESIAFYRGEKMEKFHLSKQFNSVIDNIWKIIHRTLKLSGFNLIISQISVVFPLLIQVTRYFSSQITLGDLMQTTNAFGRVQSSLSFFRNSYDNFTAYRAVLDRLTGFYLATEQVHQKHNIHIQHSEQNVQLDNLSIYRPDGSTLIDNLSLHLPLGSSLLIQGASGSGKTTLLRTIAGLWNYATGTIYCPQESLFLSQKPYLPQGSLLDAIYYPAVTPMNINLEHIQHLLKQVQLGHLCDQLMSENDWTRVLSLGEQQRLAFARLLLHKPKVAFLDEATASMDEGLEDAMYCLLRETLPTMTLISVGHRSTLLTHHGQHLKID
ncbi:ATP-binding cassette domain-containing protein [[Haemophilus] felis]|uniref:ABC transporter ATP-binding protein n=1 Tax=[Haemophilus] felis TaxID=123822 RepID=A0A1T0B575_9PAST|nr:ATP-binding cassette domain-containing protein [[Haemophilus] felis]OOS05285.1 ABC transporter ATP-binding protein [[Haemophilus] felis]